MKCPSCGADAHGKFCAECGASLQVAHCLNCQASLLPNSNFCTQCGARVRGRANPNLGWILAAGAAALLLILVLLPFFNRTDPSFVEPPPFSGRTPGTPPALSDNMRENADRLFNRVMQAHEDGDSAAVLQFAPMAIMAYQNAGPLDADGLYHLSTLQTAARDPRAAQATAEQILASTPTHLLGLAAAAEAALAQGDSAAARLYYQRFIDAFPAEQNRTLPEYQDHQNLLPGLLDRARTLAQQ